MSDMSGKITTMEEANAMLEKIRECKDNHSTMPWDNEMAHSKVGKQYVARQVMNGQP